MEFLQFFIAQNLRNHPTDPTPRCFIGGILIEAYLCCRSMMLAGVAATLP